MPCPITDLVHGEKNTQSPTFIAVEFAAFTLLPLNMLTKTQSFKWAARGRQQMPEIPASKDGRMFTL